ncbi:MAG TPA: DUF2061 domain-containing protein [Roseiarcus sp.]|jgi:uncharacterized membrane protein
MQRYLTVGLAALAGVALFEAALIPGVIIGAAAVLAPNVLAPKSRRRARPRSHASADRRDAPRFSLPALFSVKPAAAAPGGLSIKQAIAKTITFRIIVTTLDFSTNFLVIGELGTAAGLSAFALVAGPIFYLVHETAWNRFGPAEGAVDVPALPLFRRPAGGGFTINRALAKTITFRTIATAMDFTATYVVVGDVATAAGLSAFGFVFGPFVYLGHEMLWDRYRWLAEPKDVSPRPMKLLPAPA